MYVEWTKLSWYELTKTLRYWRKRNGTNTYSLKIVDAVEMTQHQIALDPISLSYYIPSYKVYRKSLLKGKFYLFYKIEGDRITIKHFRSAKQAPLYERYEQKNKIT